MKSYRLAFTSIVALAIAESLVRVGKDQLADRFKNANLQAQGGYVRLRLAKEDVCAVQFAIERLAVTPATNNPMPSADALKAVALRCAGAVADMEQPAHPMAFHHPLTSQPPIGVGAPNAPPAEMEHAGELVTASS